ncbi:DUF1565 domain-containing protein [Leptolyngbya sp. AN02str]|uniref:DUF1565 domain-containing protein n=1 Tax=Leptolyngbya sp. AN02str TaxID=3423363 RepID=UPI003D3156CC
MLKYGLGRYSTQQVGARLARFLCLNQGQTRVIAQVICTGLVSVGSVAYGSIAIASEAGDRTGQPMSGSSVSEPVLGPTLMAQTQVAAANQLLFVSPVMGNDLSGDGSQRSPFRTITRALQMARPNTAIVLGTGTYSAETGEQFPLRLPNGVVLIEDPTTNGRSVVIRGEVQGQAAIATQPRVNAGPTANAEPTVAVPATIAGAVPVPSAVPVMSAVPARPAAPARTFGSRTAQPVEVAPSRPAAPQRTFSSRRRSPISTYETTASISSAATPVRQSTTGTAIEIPVPPPESPGWSVAATPQPVRSQPSQPPQPSVPPPPSGLPQLSAAPTFNPDLLPVPSANIPTGYVGDTPTIGVPRVVANSLSFNSGGPVASRAREVGLRYRVIVRTRSDAEQSLVRSLVPGAFATFSGSEVVMQTGAFGNRDNAQAAADQLSQSGLQAIVEDVN